MGFLKFLGIFFFGFIGIMIFVYGAFNTVGFLSFLFFILVSLFFCFISLALIADLVASAFTTVVRAAKDA
jgi:cytochrome c biogenesis protein ResB